MSRILNHVPFASDRAYFRGVRSYRGAGLQADLLTLASMGCHPLSVVTALTMQDTHGVEGILAVEADWVAGQAKHLLEDMRVAAFKLGCSGRWRTSTPSPT